MNIRHGLAVMLALLAMPLPAAAAADSWRMVSTPQFRVLSQVGDRETTKWIREYQQYIAATSEALGIKQKALPPLTVILFSRDRNFTPYKLMRPDGRTAKVAGQFVTLGGTSLIGLSLDSEQEETRRTIFHEATHWLTSADPERQPTWFVEGIAEMLSTFEQGGDKVNWAKPIDVHLMQMNDFGIMPLREFLTRVDALQDQNRHDDRYYAQSWAFVHFLMLSKDKTRPQLLSRFLTLYKTLPGDEAVRQVFGEDLTALEREFNHYVRQPSFSYFTTPARPATDPPASVPAPPAIVEAALGMMAMGTNRKDLAKQHALRAAQAGPELPDGHELLAYLASDTQDYPTVRQHAEAALRAGSRDSQIYLLMADAIGRDAKGGSQESAAARARLYQQAIAISPTRHDSYEHLAGTLMFMEKPQAEHLQLMEQGQRLFPKDDWIKAGLATVKVRMGGSDDAAASIQAALRPDSALRPEQRRALGSVRRNLLLQAMDVELRTAQEKNDLAAARTIIARYRTAVGDDAEVVAYLQRRDSQFEMGQLMERVRVAMANGRTAELNPLFEQILAHPAVTPELRNLVESTRRTLK